MDLDTRERAEAKTADRPVPEATELLGISERETCRLAKLKRETGTADGSTGTRRGRPPKVGPEEARPPLTPRACGACQTAWAAATRRSKPAPARGDSSSSSTQASDSKTDKSTAQMEAAGQEKGGLP